MRDLFSICNIYTLFWCIYYFQGATSTEGTLVGRLSLLVVLAISLYYYVLLLVKRYKIPRYLKALNFVLILLSVYGAYRLFPGTEVGIGLRTVSRTDYLKNVLISILPIFTYYYFSSIGEVDIKWLRRWSIVFIAVAIYSFYGYQVKRFSMSTSLSDWESIDITNNTSYLFVYLLPIIVFFRKQPLLQYPLIFLISAFTFLGVKRGAILILVLCLLFYILKSGSRMSLQMRLLSILLTILFIAVGIRELSNFYGGNEYFQERLEETISGESSHRDVLYNDLVQFFFSQTSIINILFGNGANATIAIAGKNAHNDWLEILINQGLLGCLVFLYYWYVFFCICRKAYRKGAPDDIGIALIIIFIICFLKTLFSMSINDMNIFITSVLGFCLYSFDSSSRNIESAKCDEVYS